MSQARPSRDPVQALRHAELKALMGDGKFVRFLTRLLTHPAFANIHGDSDLSGPTATSYREGRRALGLEVLRDLRSAMPDANILGVIEAERLSARTEAPTVNPEDEDD